MQIKVMRNKVVAEEITEEVVEVALVPKWACPQVICSKCLYEIQDDFATLALTQSGCKATFHSECFNALISKTQEPT